MASGGLIPTGNLHMAKLEDISNDFLREEVETFVTREDERENLIARYTAATPKMQAIAAGVVSARHHDVDGMTADALTSGTSALDVMDHGLIAGMALVGIKFRDMKIFVPEVLACARAMKAGMKHIEPILAASGIAPTGKVIMGTVKGDLHDIGKNLCIMMLRGAAFQVIDLGVDTSPDDFIEAVEEHGANIVGMSALLTTTMPNMAKTIEAFIDADLRDDVQFMVGGAPVTQIFADEMGADGYGDNAVECVDLAKKLSDENG